MKTEKSKLPSRLQISRRKHPEHPLEIRVPKTICRVFEHPLIKFHSDAIAQSVDDAHDLNLERVPLIDLRRFETVKRTIELRDSVIMDYKEMAKRRGSSLDVMINSAIADWLDRWYEDGRPKTFIEICRIVAIDSFLNSSEDEMLYFYFNGVFGRPTQLADDSYWSELVLPEWLLELRAKYKDA